MIPRSPGRRRISSIKDQSTSERSLHTFPLEHHLNLDIVRRREGLFRFPARLTTSPSIRFPGNDGSQRLTKLLLNVNIESSLGPVHVVISSDNTVNDLIKAAIAIYVKEKRKPLLQETDPKYFELHYSQFRLESLKAEEKLINLGSRNFFLCLKPSSSVTSCGSEEGKMGCDCLFSLTKFMELLL